MRSAKIFATEAELVAAYCEHVAGHPRREGAWTAYHETAGWDLLMVNEIGEQVGIEAKLVLNAKVLEQALPKYWDDTDGPDYRAVLVSGVGLQHHLATIASHLGIVVISMEGGWPSRELPGGDYSLRPWHNWCPAARCRLPDYVPDVVGGHPSPLTLTPWKVKAIKLMVLLDRQGFVTRREIKALGMSPTIWTQAATGFLVPGEGGYVRGPRTRDLRAQHPTNYAEIEADFDRWSAVLLPKPPAG